MTLKYTGLGLCHFEVMYSRISLGATKSLLLKKCFANIHTELKAQKRHKWKLFILYFIYLFFFLKFLQRALFIKYLSFIIFCYIFLFKNFTKKLHIYYSKTVKRSNLNLSWNQASIIFCEIEAITKKIKFDCHKQHDRSFCKITHI